MAPTDRRPRILAWMVLALNGALVAGSLTLIAKREAGAVTGPEELFIILLQIVIILGFGGVGALITSRYPSNAVGWLCSGVAFSWGVAGFGVLYIEHSLDQAMLPGAPYMVVSQGFWAVGLAGAGAILPMIFPTGRPLNGRWSWVLRAVLGLMALFMAAFVVSPPESEYARLGNPLAIEAWEGLAAAVVGVTAGSIGFAALAGLVSAVLRFRRAEWRERQQIKWLVYAISLAVVLLVGSLIVEATGNERFIDIGNVLASTAISMLPIAIGIAILRHRLYDIDVLINRTAVYVVLTGLLALTYIVVVALVQGLASGIAGGEDIAVAASTLAVAGLFAPLRRRVQNGIDHLFYRRKYDSVRTLDEFATKLRDEIDLDSLTTELLDVVDDTMKPTSANLWLRPVDGAAEPG